MQKQSGFRWGWRLAAVLLIAAAVTGSGVSSPDMARAAAQSSEGSPWRRLERRKEKAEIRKLEAEGKDGLAGFFADYAAPLTALGAFLTALTAVAGVLLTLRGQNEEQARQRQADRYDREKARQQRQAEAERALDERMFQLLSDLGSDKEPVQAGAAVSLLSFLGDDLVRHRQVRLAVLANLKVPHPEAVTKLLIRTFEQAISNAEVLPLEPLELDFSGAKLFGAKLGGLNLENVSLEESNLTNAVLTGAILRGAVGHGVKLERADLTGPGTILMNVKFPNAHCAEAKFQGADLVNAHFEGADLRGARFDGARLQAAHLEFGADLRNARFDGANVADTYFRKAIFDRAALESLRKAHNWEKAHLSPLDAKAIRGIADRAEG